jgi:hypothetical protein
MLRLSPALLASIDDAAPKNCCRRPAFSEYSTDCSLVVMTLRTIV